MAHLIKLNQLDLNHDNTRTYIPILFNLDLKGTSININFKAALNFIVFIHLLF